jgi:hypothetical protein
MLVCNNTCALSDLDGVGAVSVVLGLTVELDFTSEVDFIVQATKEIEMMISKLKYLAALYIYYVLII